MMQAPPPTALATEEQRERQALLESGEGKGRDKWENNRAEDDAREEKRKEDKSNLETFFRNIKTETLKFENQEPPNKSPSKADFQKVPWTYRVLTRKKKSIVSAQNKTEKNKSSWSFKFNPFKLITNVVNGWSVTKASRGTRQFDMYYDDGYIHLIIYTTGPKFNVHVIVKDIMANKEGRVRLVVSRVEDKRENKFFSTNTLVGACDRHIYTRSDSNENIEQAKEGIGLFKDICRIKLLTEEVGLSFKTEFHNENGTLANIVEFRDALMDYTVAKNKTDPEKLKLLGDFQCWKGCQLNADQKKKKNCDKCYNSSVTNEQNKLVHKDWEPEDKVFVKITADPSLKHLRNAQRFVCRRRLNVNEDSASVLRHHLRRRLSPVSQPVDSPGTRVLRRRRLKPENRPIHRLLREIREANGLPAEPPELPELE